MPLISANQARDTALADHPASDVVMIMFPRTGRDQYSVRMYPRDEAKARHTRQIEIDARSGAIIRRIDPDLVPVGQAFMNLWMIWIHKGQFLGWPGRMIVLCTGLALIAFFPTGLYIWSRKRRARKS
jgi:uncharacterized iron-regulated membrane protein